MGGYRRGQSGQMLCPDYLFYAGCHFTTQSALKLSSYWNMQARLMDAHAEFVRKQLRQNTCHLVLLGSETVDGEWFKVAKVAAAKSRGTAYFVYCDRLAQLEKEVQSMRCGYHAYWTPQVDLLEECVKLFTGVAGFSAGALALGLASQNG